MHAAPDLILHGGKIVTVDARFNIQEAIAVQDGRIIATGTNEEVLALKDDHTEVIPLDGKMLLPGLMDSHVHPVGAATHEFDHTVPDIETIPALLDYIAARTKAQPEGSLIYVRQIFITRLKEQRYPTREELDRVAPRHPVHFSTGPDSMLNSMALQFAGIDKNYQVPAGQPGKVERDASGQPTGLLRSISPKIEGAKSNARSPDEAASLALVKKLFADYNRVGFTSIADRGASSGNLAVYQKLRDSGDLTIRVRCSHTFPTTSGWDTAEKAIDAIIAHPLRKPDPMLQIVGTKVWLDGGMLTGSALMQEPWGVSTIYGISDPAYRGTQIIPDELLEKMIRKVAASGMQFTAHSVGDGAVKLLLDTYSRISADLPALRDTRPCVTHCNFMLPESIALAAKLGAVIDLQTIWFHLDGHTLLKQFGNERMSRFQPLRAMFDAGVPVGGGSDHMQKIGSLRSINRYNPWLAMWIAVGRKCRFLDEPLHLAGGLTREEAIRLYTINNARVLFMEKDTGSLERGKLADMILIDRDILTCPLDDMQHTQVLKTWLGGKVVTQ
jgi:predicted amidohydrolase YtcJ